MPLWWVDRDEWDAAVAESGLEVEALLRLVRPRARSTSRAARSIYVARRPTVSADALYDRIARIYDPWSVSVTEDVELYVEEALASGGPVVELAVGTGRIAVPIAKAGISVIGVDQSAGMLAVAREYAEQEGVAGLLDLRVGDLRDAAGRRARPPRDDPVPLAAAHGRR